MLDIEEIRKEAKKRGLVLHEDSYRHGREIYVDPKLQSYLYEDVKNWSESQKLEM